MGRRVLMLTQIFDPEPTFKGLVFARELVKRGFEVEVVTGFPNYPGGRLYPGHALAWRKREQMEGIRVARVFLYPSHDASAVRRIANYISFALSALIYCLFSARKPDVVYVYQIPTTAVVAVLIKLFRRTAVVFDVQDIWPDSLEATGMMRSKKALEAVGRVLDWVYARADVVVVQSPGFRRTLLGRGVPASKIELIYNWCDEAGLGTLPSGESPSLAGEGAFTIVFAGNMGKAQSLQYVLDAAAVVEQACPRVRFVFIGGGVELPDLKMAAGHMNLGNVAFIPQMPMSKIGAYLHAADALLVHLKPDPLFAITIPGKTQAYMAIGKPILMAAPGDAADLISQVRCGIQARPGDPTSIAAAAIALASQDPEELREMGRRGARYYQENLALTVGADRFATIFDRVIARGGHGTTTLERRE